MDFNSRENLVGLDQLSPALMLTLVDSLNHSINSLDKEIGVSQEFSAVPVIEEGIKNMEQDKERYESALFTLHKVAFCRAGKPASECKVEACG